MSQPPTSANDALSHSDRDNLPNAGFWRRVGAMVYDSLLVIALWMAILLPMSMLSGPTIDPATGKEFASGFSPQITQPLAIISCYLFFAFFWLRNRQTLGMLAWQLEIQPNSVAGQTGDPVIPPLSLPMITKRFVGACVGFAAFGLGYLWILLDPQNRSWSDLLSGTRIVVVPKDVTT